MIQETIPVWLTSLIDDLSDVIAQELGDELPEQFAKPNHILINDYGPDQGIMGHKDGPLYKQGPLFFIWGCSKPKTA